MNLRTLADFFQVSRSYLLGQSDDREARVLWMENPAPIQKAVPDSQMGALLDAVADPKLAGILKRQSHLLKVSDLETIMKFDHECRMIALPRIRSGTVGQNPYYVTGILIRDASKKEDV
ncbi:MAG: hypothetical protein FWF59_13195 [Turicibacter sp.]|nr:hypothetical protein [Turicibacter sp.]